MSTGSLNIIDTIPSELTYIDSSTFSQINGVITYLDDDTSGSPFPFDENGFNYSAVILPGDSILFSFEASINDIASAAFIENIAYVLELMTDSIQEQLQIIFRVELPQKLLISLCSKRPVMRSMVQILLQG